jgi:hypothetical protein
MELTDWRQLSDRGPDLVPCLDFPGGRAAAGFAELAAGVRVDACFLHIGLAGAGPLAVCVDRWAAELAATGRPVRAVLGFCAGTAMATRLADAIAVTGPPPMVVLFDAVSTTGGTLASEFTSVLESSARHLTADELADARGLPEQLAETYPDDLPRIAAALTGRYDRLIRAVAGRLSVHESWLQQPPRQWDLPRILASWQERDLVPRDVAPEFVARSLRVWRASQDAVRDWRPPPYTGPIDVFGRPPAMALPATVVQRTHECSADGRLAGALRELIG